MAYDVARVRGLHPGLGDGWIRFDASAGMLVPEAVASTVSTAFRNSASNIATPHPAARRSVAVLDGARQAIADLFDADPTGVVLGPDRAVLLTTLADASAGRTGLGSEVVVTRLDEEANIAPWVRAANRYGARVKWAEADIETGELPFWQWAELLTNSTGLVAIPSASAALGSLIDVAEIAKLVHDVGGIVVVDHSAAAPYRLLDIGLAQADVVAVNALAWGGPPVGALVFRNPALIDTFARVSTDPHVSGPARLELGAHQYAMLAGMIASIDYLAGLDEAVQGTRRERLTQSMASAGAHLDALFDYLLGLLHSLPQVTVIGDTGDRIPVVSFVVNGVPAEHVVQRLADNGVLAIANPVSRVLELIGVAEIGGAVTVGLAHYSTSGEVDHLIRAVASLG